MAGNKFGDNPARARGSDSVNNRLLVSEVNELGMNLRIRRRLQIKNGDSATTREEFVDDGRANSAGSAGNDHMGLLAQRHGTSAYEMSHRPRCPLTPAVGV